MGFGWVCGDEGLQERDVDEQRDAEEDIAGGR
jgi:hypothetical protein